MIAFACATYDLTTGQELEQFDWTCSAEEMRALFSPKERGKLIGGSFVEIDDERLNVTTRYAIKEGTKT
jgi:hypothetical protein